MLRYYNLQKSAGGLKSSLRSLDVSDFWLFVQSEWVIFHYCIVRIRSEMYLVRNIYLKYASLHHLARNVSVYKNE